MTHPVLRTIAGVLALLSLAVCLAAPVLFFAGRISEPDYKTAFLAGSIAWFVFAVAWGFARKGPAERPPMP
jgi:hypothetical protein